MVIATGALRPGFFVTEAKRRRSACKKEQLPDSRPFDKMGDAQVWSLFYITAVGGNVLSQTWMVPVPKPEGKTEVRIYSRRAKG